MLTINKPVQYGDKPVHDLPTPPSTSRPSPPLTHLELGQRPPLSAPGGSGSPSDQLMSAPHRGLPPPAALPPVPAPPGSGPSQPPPSLSIGQSVPPPPHLQGQTLGQLPPAPPWHEESMRAWLVAKAEEDKRRQEEERTRQESYRLEQRKTEHEILRTSLQGGIPPPLVPVVFAGLGGGALSPAALEWAQQFMMPQSPQPHPPALMPSGAVSSEQQRRDSHAQSFGQYPLSVGVPSTPGSAQGPPAAYMSGYPGSPTRPRGQSMPGAMAGRSHPGSGSNLPNLNINVQGGPGGTSGVVGHQPGMAQPQQQQQEQQASPSIYFHHWQPPTTQAGGRGGTDQPATPSGSSKKTTSRAREAVARG
ncbi:ab795c5c-949c-424c-ad29-a8088eacf3a7 [Thermothielavioides terrestris]|uniref:Ab795c5c-949c-424c-ad29-a8088eacf3a7 n=1 Tax=Thermothielavioides terrestris TaxID=2587410 RepID=A0A3S4CCT7_9PEZI|nr:ab795c5c-949c-424c-ad29-a8088eacf3a7 [Thermothielavioides terrestris]